ncbi:MAG: DUF167 domain-containing protein [Candidatus Hydrogenedentota bacterium]|nr:MAG: DUF167 domain-containing protein [Candidatus Hydrogenedentota bacterium]
MKRITILAKPGCRRDSVEPQSDGTFVVRVRAKPEKGRANEAIAAALARYFGIPKRSVRIITTRSRRKIVEIDS